jgi:hypothetical protein
VTPSMSRMAVAVPMWVMVTLLVKVEEDIVGVVIDWFVLIQDRQ